MQHFQEASLLLPLVSTSLGNKDSIFINRPSLVELRRKARITKGPGNKNKSQLSLEFIDTF